MESANALFVPAFCYSMSLAQAAAGPSLLSFANASTVK